MDLRVALVEDDEDYRFLLEATMDGLGVKNLQSFANAEDFLNKSTPADLVLLDLTLPGMHGLEALRRLRESQEGRQVPVVILSSSKAQEDVEEAYDAGARGYLVKPIELGELEDLLEDLINLWSQMARPHD